MTDQRDNSGSAARASGVEALRRFHLAPEVEGSAGLPEGHSWVPALLGPYLAAETLRTELPVFLGPAAGGLGQPAMAVGDLLTAVAPEPSEARVLVENLPRLEAHLRRAGSEIDTPVAARELVRRAADAVLDEVGLAEAEARRLAADLDAMVERIPEGGRLAPFAPRLALDLLVHAAGQRLADAREDFAAELRRSLDALESRLEVEHQGESRQAYRLQGALGALGSRFIDSSRMSSTLGPYRGGTPLAPALRKRAEAALETLRGGLAPTAEPTLVVGEGGLAELLGVAELPGWQVVDDLDPLETAGRLFDERAEALAELLRATHLARLLAADAYEPARHDPWLDYLDWHAFTRRELLLLPTVAALVSTRHLAAVGLPALSALLLSGRPLQVVVATRPGHHGDGEPLAAGGFHFEPGYLGVAHREAFVSQCSLARPVHAYEGFRRAVASTRSGLHVVAMPSVAPTTGPGAWLRSSAAVDGRAHPLFSYDPEAGLTWARRFEAADNPAPDADWPVGEIEPAPRPGEGTHAFTFADVCLLVPAWSADFAPLPEDVPEAEVETLASHLARGEEGAEATIPYVWALDERSRPRRLAVSRRLMLACRDRLAFWRTVQELSGVRSEHADRAAAAARTEVEERAERERRELVAAHDAELEEVRATAVRAAAEQITAALLDVDPALFAPPPGEAPAAHLAGQSVEEVAATLGQWLESGNGSTESAPPSAEADALAASLLDLVATDSASDRDETTEEPLDS